jgi:pimeloyl-ACP methyl ester carboxylesterase
MFGSSDYRVLSPGMRQTFNLLVARDLEPELKRIQSPTLLIWGDRDTATPLWMGQAMEKAIPDAGLVVFEGAGHFAYLDQYARFRAVVEKFLN